MEKRLTGLTDRQKDLLTCFHEGKSDADIEKELEIGSRSTVRNHRFTLREKAKQAKAYLAIIELLDAAAPKGQRFVPVHAGATMVDERYAITEDETGKILKKYVKDGILLEFPMKQKRKLVILRWLAAKFAPGTRYAEKEVNGILQATHDDYVTLRRYLIEYGFMERMPDGSEYWLVK